MKANNKRLKLMANCIDSYFLNYDTLDVLDIGYAWGVNKYLLKNHKLNITGIDLISNRSDLHYQNEILLDATEDLSYLGKFDVIMAGEFIEHIEKPYDFLKGLHKISKENTILIFSTPNPLALNAIPFEYFLSKKYFNTLNHTYCFLPRWMIRIFHKTGWSAVKLKSVGLDFFYINIPVPFILSNQIIYIAKPENKL